MAPKSNCHEYHTEPRPCSYLRKLEALVDSFPPIDSAASTSAYQKVLAQTLLFRLPNYSISAHPRESNIFSNVSYSYTGSHRNYTEAFASFDKSEAVRFFDELIGVILGYYSVACLTDEIRDHVSVALDTTALNGALSAFWTTMDSYCAYLYIASFKFEYSPTAKAIAAIPQRDRPNAAQELHRCIRGGHFTANVNWSISQGGDSSRAASWFLFNLWVSLYVLGYPDVDAAIEEYASPQVGLKVPAQLRKGEWNTGGYISWFQQSLGNHMYSKTIRADFPQDKTVASYPSGRPFTNPSYYPCGYSYSFCEWGDLAWYKPGGDSCFGEDTFVLMANSSVKRIKDVVKDDLVHTTKGARRVIMVESPSLGKRQLWSINGLDLSFTSGHCFRTSEGSPKRVAVDEMVTMDSAPTMIMDGGVGKCQKGSQIHSVNLRDGLFEMSSIVVKELKSTVQSEEGSETQKGEQKVYDIILENWWSDGPAYFVGGPQTFLAVDSETSNPLSDPSTSAAILATMDGILSALRTSLASPLQTLFSLSLEFDMRDIERRASAMAYAALGCNSFKRLRIPKTSLFENGDGSWSEYVSYMEYFLISRFGRWLRSVIRINSQSSVTCPLPNDVLVVGIHDVELSGDHGLESGSTANIELNLSNGREKEIQMTSFTNDTESSLYLLAVHECCNFECADRFVHGSLYGIMKCGEKRLGRFNCSVVMEGNSGRLIETALFAPDHKVIGRLGVSIRRMHAGFEGWETPSDSMMLLKGVAVGRLLGQRFVEALDEKSGGSGFDKWLCN